MPDPVPQSSHHAFLCLLADSLGTALADDGEAVLIHVSSKPGGPELGVLRLDGQAPAEYLLGAVAPPEWSALGVATRGRARSLTGHGPVSAAEVVVIVPRVGEVVSRVRHGGVVITDPPACGLTLDCLQRALGLPTAPPQVPANHVLASAWLHTVLSAGDVDAALDLLPPGTEGSLDWDRLRQLVIDGHWHEPTLTPGDAAWLDAGSFARWILSERPSLPAMLAEVAGVLGPAEAQHCAGVLRGLGLEVAPLALSSRRRSRRRRVRDEPA